MPLSVDYLKAFDTLKDRVARIQLPNNLRLAESAAGIKTDSKPVLRVISKTARIAETGFKLLSELNEDPSLTSSKAKVTFDNLFALFAAQMQFLQQEYANLVVQNTFDQETGRLFRQFENHTSAFSTSQLQNVRVAAELAAITSRQTRRPSRGGDRGSYSNSFPRRSNFNGIRNFTPKWRSDYTPPPSFPPGTNE